MAAELAHIRAALQQPQEERQLPHAVWRGALGHHAVFLVQCDIGKVNAAMAAQALMTHYQVDMVFNIGSSGAISPLLEIGDLVVATEAVQHDVDLSGFGLARGEVMFDVDLAPASGQLHCRKQAAFATDARLRELAVQVVALDTLEEVGARKPVLHRGRVLSGDGFLNDAAAGQRLGNELGGLCVDMEAAAIAQVCVANDVPLLVLRAVSDKADGDSHVDFHTFLEAATKNYARIVIDVIALV